MDDYTELVELLRTSKITTSAGSWTPTLCIDAADAIEALQAENEQRKKTPTEDGGYRFYYCDSENSYLLGRRLGNFYYAHWHDGLGFVWDMSRYLPWGEHVVNMNTLWKEHTYPSEPHEIGEAEWFKGFLQQRNGVVDNESIILTVTVKKKMLDGIAHLQNADNGVFIATTKSGKELTILVNRIEGIADMNELREMEGGKV